MTKKKLTFVFGLLGFILLKADPSQAANYRCENFITEVHFQSISSTSSDYVMNGFRRELDSGFSTVTYRLSLKTPKSDLRTKTIEMYDNSERIKDTSPILDLVAVGPSHARDGLLLLVRDHSVTALLSGGEGVYTVLNEFPKKVLLDIETRFPLGVLGNISLDKIRPVKVTSSDNGSHVTITWRNIEWYPKFNAQTAVTYATSNFLRPFIPETIEKIESH